MLGGAGCVALRGLSAGRASRAVAAAELLAAAADADANDRPVYVDVDAEGYLVPAGARGTCGAAALAARARLAPGNAVLERVEAPGNAVLERVEAARSRLAPGNAVLERVEAARSRLAPGNAVLERVEAPGNAVLERVEPAAPGAWRVVVTAAAAPHAELLLWPSEDALERAAVPHLTPDNKIGPGEYGCHRCDARFDAPHMLRVHLFLGCRTPSALLFLSALVHGASSPLDLRSAFRPYTGASPARLAPAALEALATAWGRGAGGGAGHACLYCGRLYSRRYGLKIHLRTHTGYKPLRCPHCRRAFGDPSNLNKHVKLHGAGAGAARGGGAHACAECGKLLVRRRDLERHMRARHPPSEL
ncbi:PR domain zinc finger protein 13-like [Leguminivora glycinivorella]|uniref:PR domain zinc finger protein 13-like n=1 Tax=Leguminivora glycinivorella TaxID=1035111 RepID=UPI00200EC358|nr:PR domain zinc finger protein 13-like [Leguminivora glycinivorella]